MSAIRGRRPGGVTLLVLLLWVQALIGVAGGVVLILLHRNHSLLQNAHRSSGTILALGIIILVIGVITALIAGALGRGSNLARWIVAIVSALHIAGAVLTFIRVHGDSRIGAIADGCIALLVLYVLFGERGSREYFTGRAFPTR